MKKNQFIQDVGYLKFIGSLAVASFFILPGCATQSPSNESSSAKAISIVPADESTPNMPVVVAELVVDSVIETPKAPESEPETGSVASILKKMETSPYTLYWRQKDTYSYYVGGLVDAKYQPGVGLVVKDDLPDETSITCKYDDAGSLGGIGKGEPKKDQKIKEACSKLMFALDSELSG